MKRCTKCLVEKPMSEFYRDKHKKDGLKPFCKGCAKVGDAAYYDAKREYILDRLKNKRAETGPALDVARMGITVEQYNAMLEAQDYKCLICGQEETLKLRDGRVRRLVIDHDHSCCPQDRDICGKCVRGLLCSRCNSGLGYFLDNTETMRKAIDYLDKNRRT